MSYRLWLMSAIFFCQLLLQGCVAVQSFPTVARSGDTITLAVGSPEGMTVGNTTVLYISDSDPGNPVDLTTNIRNIIKIYPDKRTPAWYGSSEVITDTIGSASAHGAWLSVIVLDLPAMPALPVGPGHFNISTTASYPSGAKDVNGVEVPMEVIAGTGSAATFDYWSFSFSSTPTPGNLDVLEPSRHVEVKPPFIASYHPYGAIEIKLHVPINTSSGSVSDNGIRVIFDDSPDNLTSRRQATWVRNGDDFTLNIMSQTGDLYHWEARASIVLQNVNYSFPSSPSLISIKYYDVNGVLDTGPVPSVSLVN